MSDRFKITGSEVNEVILNSPYSLADSPALLGQKSSQTKRYFYQFIKTLAEKINLHLGEIDASIINGEAQIEEVYERIGELAEVCEAALCEHNENTDSHIDIRQKIIDETGAHNKSLIAHKDIREALDALELDIEVALTLAGGKSRILSFGDEMELFEYAISSGRVGDVLLLEDAQKPDFTVFGVGVSQKDGDTVLDMNDIATGTELLPNKKYFIDGVRLVSSEGHLEAAIFAKKDEVDSMRALFLSILDAMDSRLYEFQAQINAKETAMKKHTIAAQTVHLESMNEYHLATVDSLTITTAEDEFFEAILCFKTGSGEITVDAPAELLFTGDDTLEGRFYPVPKRLYEISIKLVSGVMLARVGSVDYEVIM